MNDIQLADKLTEKINQVKKELKKKIVGQEDVIDLLLINLFCKGHSLLIGVPGLAKTLLIKSLAEALDLAFNRIQFTPDLMPSDITGTEILEEDLNTRQRYFKYIKGPVFANIVLADEINRTPPKTQSALLEAMQENRVTASGKTFALPDPFFVLATQNPIEQEGTYPLPEAQLDRFMFSILMSYPSLKNEIEIVKSTTVPDTKKIDKIISADEIRLFQELVKKVPVGDTLVEHAVELVRNTRPAESKIELVKNSVNWGAGPRASQYLVLAAKAKAVIEKRYTPDFADVDYFAQAVLRHRVLLNFSAEAEGITPELIIKSVVEFKN